MKTNTTPRLKGTLLAIALFFGGHSLIHAQTTLPASTPDGIPKGSNTVGGVQHTGTDALAVKSKLIGTQRYQVMTWDSPRGNVVFSWAINGAPLGSINLTDNAAQLSDPDVAMGYYNGKLYAVVVYIRTPQGTTAGQTHYQVVEYGYNSQSGSFEFIANQAPIALGIANNNVGQVRRHESPNIDINQFGNMAMVWQETVVETATITYTSPSYPPPGISNTQEVTFGEAYATAGYADGTLLPCTTPRGNSFALGRLATKEPRLLEQSLQPDVAVADDSNNPTVSFAYRRKYFDAVSYQVGESLSVRQVSFDCLGSEVSAYEWNASIPNPRIAATNSSQHPQDVEVVGSWVSGNCTSTTGYGILNFGKSNGSFRPNPTEVAPYTDADRPAGEPVVAYQAQLGRDKGIYVVSWTGSNYPDGDANDIWARAMQAGIPVANGASRVNYQFDGNQRTSSIAGRHLDGSNAAYLFFNEQTADLGYKISGGLAGADPLRPASSSALAPVLTTPNASFQSYPNPTTGNTVFTLPTVSGEAAREIVIYDMMGRQVDRVTIAEGSNMREVTWRVPQNLPAGNYQAKLITNKGVQTLRLEKAK